ncbi:hypothetical protein [Streptomonospora litoralis]|uniref:Uncharacterized protein n=1 Tax=Streptomonospora litoralis TaxID=2498135 RepID=A0A4P6Q675_9ACTN|nr:hypothetical protein [Streptomonospora litoralis]QBI56215.1 hypothetical protein EKD16_22310 [Streptomonospora litoralis]
MHGASPYALTETPHHEAALDESAVADAADANGEEDFGLVFDTAFEDKVYEIAESRTEFLRMFSDNDGFREEFVRKARGRAYRRLRRDAA